MLDCDWLRYHFCYILGQDQIQAQFVHHGWLTGAVASQSKVAPDKWQPVLAGGLRFTLGLRMTSNGPFESSSDQIFAGNTWEGVPIICRHLIIHHVFVLVLWFPLLKQILSTKLYAWLKRKICHLPSVVNLVFYVSATKFSYQREVYSFTVKLHSSLLLAQVGMASLAFWATTTTGRRDGLLR